MSQTIVKKRGSVLISRPVLYDYKDSTFINLDERKDIFEREML
jgi:hypothetical protein